MSTGFPTGVLTRLPFSRATSDIPSGKNGSNSSPKCFTHSIVMSWVGRNASGSSLSIQIIGESLPDRVYSSARMKLCLKNRDVVTGLSFSSQPAASPASPAPRIATRFPLPGRCATCRGRAQLRSERQGSPPTANPDSFTNSRRPSFMRPPSYRACLVVATPTAFRFRTESTVVIRPFTLIDPRSPATPNPNIHTSPLRAPGTNGSPTLDMAELRCDELMWGRAEDELSMSTARVHPTSKFTHFDQGVPPRHLFPSPFLV